jgi:hypothetical protein
MPPTKKAARIAGLLYLFVVLAGPFVLLYVPGRLFVAGDASATARNILAHEPLFRANIVIGLVSELFFVATALALYRLLRGVHVELAALMVILILLDAPLAFLGTANEAAALALLRGGDFLRAFDGPQRDALALLLLEFDRKGVFASEAFWGLWLLPLGALVYRSQFLPRFLGGWLFVNGLAYLAMSATGLLLPEYVKTVSTAVTPLLFGEVALMLWLLIVGVRSSGETAPADSQVT